MQLAGNCGYKNNANCWEPNNCSGDGHKQHIIKIHCRIQNVDEIKIDNKRETLKESDMQCNNAIMQYVICKLLQMMTQHQRKNMFPVLNWMWLCKKKLSAFDRSAYGNRAICRVFLSLTEVAECKNSYIYKSCSACISL